MIAAGEPQVYVPHGRMVLEQYENPDSRRASAFNTTSLEPQEIYHLSPLDGANEQEEEVYLRDNTVVWSRGNGDVYWELVKKFTSEGPVQQVLWFEFDENPNRPACPNNPQTVEKTPGCKIPSLCIVEKSKVTIHTRDGDEYICAVPYEIQRVWTTRFGLIIEKCMGSNPDIPNWFSLYHPLEEIVPVVLRDQGADLRDHVHLAKGRRLQFVYTGANPSVCVTFNEDTGLHSIWLIRKAEIDESLFLGANSTKGTMNPLPSQSFSSTFVQPSSSMASPSLSRSFALSQLHNASLQSPANLTNLFNNTGKLTPKFDADSSRLFHTPKGSKSFVQPFAPSSLQLTQATRSPLRRVASNRTSAILARTPAPSPTASSLCYNDTEQANDDEEPLLPDLCLHILWTEDVKRGSSAPAIKAFVSQDWLGKTAICWLLEDEKVLRCVDTKITENKSTGNPLYICCAPWTLPARDAEYIASLKAVLVLDPTFDGNNSLTLYSGATKLAKVHVPSSGPPNGAGIISMSMQRLSLDPLSESGIGRRLIPSTPLNSSRRSSLMLPAADFRDTSVVLSPIPTSSSPQPSFRALQDAIGHHVTIRCSDRTFLRTSLPPLASSVLIERCLAALRVAIPPDAYLTLSARFYCSRNAPGPADFSPQSELAAFRSTLLAFLGFDAKFLDGTFSPLATSPDKVAKKCRTNLEEGSLDDWKYLIESPYARSLAQLGLLNLPEPSTRPESRDREMFRIPVNSDASYFGHLPHVLLVLHLLYEDLKLDALLWDDARLLATVLIPLASALQLSQYCDLYWRDFPTAWNSCVSSNHLAMIQPSDLEKLQGLLSRMETPANIHAHLMAIMSRRPVPSGPFPHAKKVNARSRDVVTLYAILYGREEPDHLLLIHDYVRDLDWAELASTSTQKPLVPVNMVLEPGRRQAAAVLKMSLFGWNLDHVEALPAGIGLPLRHALFRCQLEPPTDWPDEAYRLINRLDMCQCPAVSLEAASLLSSVPELNLKSEAQRNKSSGGKDDSAEDGMEDVVELPLWKMLFPRDHRIQEVRRLLGSSRPVAVVLPASTLQGLSEHELIEEREKHLLVLCIRIMALPVGRGMFTLHTTTPTVTETLSIPRLCLTGKTPHNGANVDMTHIDVPPNMSVWPQFHNGVAAGLRVSPQTKYVDSNWVNLSRRGTPPSAAAANQNEMSAEAAGFLLGLGLTGHLIKFSDLVLNEHLKRDHEMTQLALILGLGIGRRGSMDAGTLRIISAFVESLAPSVTGMMNGCSGSTIEVPQNVRVAALMSIGFLYQGSAHRYMTEVLLAEIDRPPGPEMDNCVDRESYSLSAGLALGLVTLGQGGQMVGLADLRLADTLYHFMVGGAKRTSNGPGSSPSRSRNFGPGTSASYQIREGNTVNVDVTAPGAILALGLMFHRTNNEAVAQWMTAPDSQQLLDSIRPDLLLLRTLARGLIMWDKVMPTRDWVESNVPPNVRRYSLRNPGEPESQSEQVDYETMNQAFYNIMAGACFALGLKFAGSANAEAFQTLHRYAKVLISLSGRSVAEWAGKATLEACLNVLLLSLSMVMAGTGDLQVLRLCRHLRMRSGTHSSVVTYGSHIATHMALGFLFLGGGRLSLSTSPESIAALVCACYPKFPTHSNDNRYHLQAMRHLYVLATQPRLLLPLESSGSAGLRPCYAGVQVVFRDEAGSYQLRAPCLLPELRFLQRVQLLDPRYRSIVFDQQHNWHKLERILAGGDHLVVQRKAGCLSYAEDPTGLASLATPTLSAWAIRTGTVANFSMDPFILFLCRYFLPSAGPASTDSVPLETPLRLLSLVLNDCVVNEKSELIRPWLQLLHQIRIANSSPSSQLPLWQLKFLVRFPVDSTSFIEPEMVLALRHQLESAWDRMSPTLRSELQKYLSFGKEAVLSQQRSEQLAQLAVFFDIPLPLATELATDPVSLLVQLGDQKLAAKLAVLLFL